MGKIKAEIYGEYGVKMSTGNELYLGIFVCRHSADFCNIFLFVYILKQGTRWLSLMRQWFASRKVAGSNTRRVWSEDVLQEMNYI